MFGRISLAFLVVSIAAFFCAQSAEAAKQPRITHKVYFDIEHGGESLGRTDVLPQTVPKTVENFRALATGKDKEGNELGYGYKGSKFHRVIKDFIDFDRVSPVNSATPVPEFSLWQTQARTLTVVFGRVLEGMDIVHTIENVPKGRQDRPAQDVIIADSGELPVEETTATETSTTATEEHDDIAVTPAATATPEESKPESAAQIPVHTTYPSFGTVVFGLTIFGAMCALFVWIGGVRYVRRFLPGGRNAVYRKLGVEDGHSQ
ncbi:hypothetical protein H0H92_004693 [Tricholoma furcatifolium]|nr:hypothetical protein H0H92_004693 [Tricholoma furcatifolium]